MSENDTPSEGPLTVEQYVQAEEEHTEPQAEEVESVEAAEVAEETEEAEEAETQEDETPEEQADTQILSDEYDDILVQVGDEQVSLRELKKGQLRQSDYSRKTQDLAEQRKQFEQEKAAFQAQQQQAPQQNDRPPDLTSEDIQEIFSSMDSSQANIVIAQYKAKQEEWDKSNAEKQEAASHERQAFIQKTAQAFLEKFPDYSGNETAFNAVVPELKGIASEFSITETEFANNPDMRLVGLIEEIRSLRSRLSRKRDMVEKKIVNTPKVLKPGSKADPNAEKAKKVAAIQSKYSGPLTPQQYAQLEQEMAALS